MEGLEANRLLPACLQVGFVVRDDFAEHPHLLGYDAMCVGTATFRRFVLSQKVRMFMDNIHATPVSQYPYLH